MRLRSSRVVGAIRTVRSAAGAGRLTAARFAAFVSIVGLTFAFAWPALATIQTDATNATPVAAPELRGEFTVAIAKEDVPINLAGGPILIGLWTITFDGNGTYTVARQDVGVVASGTYRVDGSTLTFDEWSGLVACGSAQGADSGASYAWQIQNGLLVLTPIEENCAEREVLLTTRALGTYEACATVPMSLPALPTGPGQPAGQVAPASVVPIGPAATPTAASTPAAAATPSVAIQEGTPEGATPEEAIDELLRQATGCWATGDPARFLPLHSQQVVANLLGTIPTAISDLRNFMTTPASFKRIGDVNVIDPTHAWAYVEITFGGQAVPQRFDFVKENGVWLFDSFFLLGPPVPTPMP